MSGKKQAAVKAVPRAKLEGKDLVKEQHVKVSSYLMFVYIIVSVSHVIITNAYIL